MIIHATEDYRVSSDAHQWIVEHRYVFGEKSKRCGDWEWRPLTFHPTLPQAGQHLLDRLWREETDPDRLRDLARVVREAVEESQWWTDLEARS